jgi:AcrR family transcriptional regulator
VPRRAALNIERIIDACVEVADAGGIANVSMRHVAQALGVEAMSLYHHVPNKEALIDALANWAFSQVELPDPTRPWRDSMTDRARSMRSMLHQHRWALGLIESRRNPGLDNLRHHDRTLACLRANGFSIDLAGHAYSVLDAYIYGFVLTEVNLPMYDNEATEDFIAEFATMLDPEEFPSLVEFVNARVIGQDYHYADEFEVGLAIILDRLEQLHSSQTPRRHGRGSAATTTRRTKPSSPRQ